MRRRLRSYSAASVARLLLLALAILAPTVFSILGYAQTSSEYSEASTMIHRYLGGLLANQPASYNVSSYRTVVVNVSYTGRYLVDWRGRVIAINATLAYVYNFTVSRPYVVVYSLDRGAVLRFSQYGPVILEVDPRANISVRGDTLYVEYHAQGTQQYIDLASPIRFVFWGNNVTELEESLDGYVNVSLHVSSNLTLPLEAANTSQGYYNYTSGPCLPYCSSNPPVCSGVPGCFKTYASLVNKSCSASCSPGTATLYRSGHYPPYTVYQIISCGCGYATCSSVETPGYVTPTSTVTVNESCTGTGEMTYNYTFVYKHCWYRYYLVAVNRTASLRLWAVVHYWTGSTQDIVLAELHNSTLMLPGNYTGSGIDYRASYSLDEVLETIFSRAVSPREIWYVEFPYVSSGYGLYAYEQRVGPLDDCNTTIAYTETRVFTASYIDVWGFSYVYGTNIHESPTATCTSTPASTVTTTVSNTTTVSTVYTSWCSCSYSTWTETFTTVPSSVTPASNPCPECSCVFTGSVSGTVCSPACTNIGQPCYGVSIYCKAYRYYVDNLCPRCHSCPPAWLNASVISDGFCVQEIYLLGFGSRIDWQTRIWLTDYAANATVLPIAGGLAGDIGIMGGNFSSSLSYVTLLYSYHASDGLYRDLPVSWFLDYASRLWGNTTPSLTPLDWVGYRFVNYSDVASELRARLPMLSLYNVTRNPDYTYYPKMPSYPGTNVTVSLGLSGRPNGALLLFTYDAAANGVVENLGDYVTGNISGLGAYPTISYGGDAASDRPAVILAVGRLLLSPVIRARALAYTVFNASTAEPALGGNATGYSKVYGLTDIDIHADYVFAARGETSTGLPVYVLAIEFVNVNASKMAEAVQRLYNSGLVDGYTVIYGNNTDRLLVVLYTSHDPLEPVLVDFHESYPLPGCYLTGTRPGSLVARVSVYNDTVFNVLGKDGYFFYAYLVAPNMTICSGGYDQGYASASYAFPGTGGDIDVRDWSPVIYALINDYLSNYTFTYSPVPGYASQPYINLSEASGVLSRYFNLSLVSGFNGTVFPNVTGVYTNATGNMTLHVISVLGERLVYFAYPLPSVSDLPTALGLLDSVYVAPLYNASLAPGNFSQRYRVLHGFLTQNASLAYLWFGDTGPGGGNGSDTLAELYRGSVKDAEAQAVDIRPGTGSPDPDALWFWNRTTYRAAWLSVIYYVYSYWGTNEPWLLVYTAEDLYKPVYLVLFSPPVELTGEGWYPGYLVPLHFSSQDAYYSGYDYDANSSLTVFNVSVGAPFLGYLEKWVSGSSPRATLAVNASLADFDTAIQDLFDYYLYLQLYNETHDPYYLRLVRLSDFRLPVLYMLVNPHSYDFCARPNLTAYPGWDVRPRDSLDGLLWRPRNLHYVFSTCVGGELSVTRFYSANTLVAVMVPTYPAVYVFVDPYLDNFSMHYVFYNDPFLVNASLTARGVLGQYGDVYVPFINRTSYAVPNGSVGHELVFSNGERVPVVLEAPYTSDIRGVSAILAFWRLVNETPTVFHVYNYSLGPGGPFFVNETYTAVFRLQGFSGLTREIPRGRTWVAVYYRYGWRNETSGWRLACLGPSNAVSITLTPLKLPGSRGLSYMTEEVSRFIASNLLGYYQLLRLYNLSVTVNVPLLFRECGLWLPGPVSPGEAREYGIRGWRDMPWLEYRIAVFRAVDWSTLVQQGPGGAIIAEKRLPPFILYLGDVGLNITVPIQPPNKSIAPGNWWWRLFIAALVAAVMLLFLYAARRILVGEPAQRH